MCASVDAVQESRRDRLAEDDDAARECAPRVCRGARAVRRVGLSRECVAGVR